MHQYTDVLARARQSRCDGASGGALDEERRAEQHWVRRRQSVVRLDQLGSRRCVELLSDSFCQGQGRRPSAQILGPRTWLVTRLARPPLWRLDCRRRIAHAVRCRSSFGRWQPAAKARHGQLGAALNSVERPHQVRVPLAQQRLGHGRRETRRQTPVRRRVDPHDERVVRQQVVARPRLERCFGRPGGQVGDRQRNERAAPQAVARRERDVSPSDRVQQCRQRASDSPLP